MTRRLYLPSFPVAALLVKTAVRVLPTAWRARFREEWLAELDEARRQNLAAVPAALGMLRAAPSVGGSLRREDRRHPIRRTVAAAAFSVDIGIPNTARMYDYFLGGKDNYPADRQAAEQVLRVLPDAALVARANRSFMAAAVRQVAAFGVGQFIDVGTGLPTAPSVHQCARLAIPGARVAYVDNDPVVVAHSRALLPADDRIAVISGDARDSAAILADPQLRSLIDMTRPVCVMFVSMPHFIPTAEADAAVAAFRDAMAPGSYLVISAGHGNERNMPAKGHVRASYGRSTTLTGRSATEIASYFGDFELVAPGLVPVTHWPATAPDAPLAPTKAGMLVGIGRKPVGPLRRTGSGRPFAISPPASRT